MESRELYMMWINWEEQIVSFHEVPGFDRLPFGIFLAGSSRRKIGRPTSGSF